MAFTGSTVLRSRSDLSTMSPSVDQIEEKVVASEFKGTVPKHKYNGIPMKMLIAQEISKDVNSGNSSPNLIAKLMGLDDLPHQQPGSVNQKSLLGHQRSRSEISMSKWEQQTGMLDDVEPRAYTDAREISNNSLKPNLKDRSVTTAKHRQMAFVRQKFIEAKRLSMDQKLRQSKQFQDALEVLCSNKELFLKCLQEPISVFSQQLHQSQSVPPPPAEKKRITVLRPSNTAGSSLAVVGAEQGKQVSKGTFTQLKCFEGGGNSPPPCSENYQGPAQPTRIVVLKPSSVKLYGDSAVGFPQSESSSRDGVHHSGIAEECESLESRAVAKAITQQMRNKLGRHRRDEMMISSAFSNGYVADESSFNKSEFELPAGNLSDSEAMSPPASRHTWDYVNRIGSPYSSSSYSGLSYSPESSVCREAKKRLSERWAMMASNGSLQDERFVQKSTSTLGEMLALSETKKTAMPGGEDACAEPMDLKSLFVSESRADEYLVCSPRSLVRSKSVPLSSTLPCETKLNSVSPISDKGKPSFPEVSRTLSGGISSIRGKVSSLFFSRNKRSSKGKTTAIEVQMDTDGSCLEQGPDHVEPSLWRPLGTATSSEDIISHEPEVSVSRPIPSGVPCRNQHLESPVSVLEPPFEETDETARIPGRLNLERRGSDLPFNSITSNLIDKSPPIGSIARTLSWDDSYVDTSSTYPIKDSISFLGKGEAEEEWSHFLKTLLSITGLQGEVQSSLFLSRWHSPESPLDPSLRDKYMESNDKGTLHEAKRRQKRSMQKLVFDCVNAALIEMSGYASGSGQRALASTKEYETDDVFAWINSLLISDITCCCDELGDESSSSSSSIAVERVVNKEVVGKRWNDKVRLEMDCLEMEIGRKLMEELVEETVVGLRSKGSLSRDET